MSLALFLRNKLVNLPLPVGILASRIPFSVRPGIGSLYKQRRSEISQYNDFNSSQRQEFILNRMSYIINYAYKNIPFYKQFYDENDFHPSMLVNFEDINLIPVLSKEILLNYSISERSNIKVKKFHANTGGSTGKTLSFFVQPSRMANEWAHLHYFWEKQMGFKYSDLKINFDGRSDVRNKISYDFVRHSLRIDIYQDFKLISNEILTRFKKVKVRFLHGYPSAIYEFAKYCEKDECLLTFIKRHIKGIILNSEFPHDYFRDKIEITFGVKTYSFFGHTEGCIMAWENGTRNTFKALQSYGFCESVRCESKNYLVGTNYYNFASPLIRYNTEDLITNLYYQDNILDSFSIVEGREGEYILDINSKKIPLTGLIFGRHHKLFDRCEHIQISQKQAGFAKVLYSSKNNIDNPEMYFDTNNINIKFDFIRINEPIRTVSGKIKLKISEF